MMVAMQGQQQQLEQLVNNYLFTVVNKKIEDLVKKLDNDRIILMMDKLTGTLDKSEREGADVVQDMQRRMKEKADN